MIGVKLNGRLGNQLFQYAFIYTASKILNKKFYLDKSIEPFLVPNYFIVDDNPNVFDYIFSIKGFKNLFSFYLKKSYYKWLMTIFNLKKIEISNEQDPQTVIQNIKNNQLFEGYFQSELYFYPYREEIKKKFILQQRYIDEYNLASKDILKQKIIAIHVRKGDYKYLDFYLPISYYHQALKEVLKGDEFCVFLSDEPHEIEKEFEYLPNKMISKNSEIVDFQFLMNADVCILSNSSFSWWGAYLNKNNPEIYVPKNWMNLNNQEHPTAIIQPTWKSI